MASQELVQARNHYEYEIQRYGIDENRINALAEVAAVAFGAENDSAYGIDVSKSVKEHINSYVELIIGKGKNIWDLEKMAQESRTEYSLVSKYYEILRMESRDLLESFMLYMERKRPIEERFYQPRINPLRQVAKGIQDLADDKLDELFINCPSRIGKTQIVKFGFLWFGSKNPEKSNLYTAYSDKIIGGFYDGLIELMTDPTYTYAEIFPENVEKKIITDGRDMTIDLIRKKSYPTFTARSIYGTLNGACDCSGLAIDDDLFSGIEEAISVDRQKTVWDKFDNNFMKRLKRKAKLINMGTRWALGDVQGRRRNLLENKEEYKNRRYRIISIPALDENDESNFDYPYDLGYSTDDYKMMRASFEENDDMASWYAQCQQEPIERLGALFELNGMAEFFKPEDLPDRQPDRIFAAVDEAFGGGDYVAMPICYQYDTEYYIVDVIYDKGDKKITRPRIVEKILLHKIAAVNFEETKTTSEYREWIEETLKEKGYRFNSTHSAAQGKLGKRNRIFDKAPEIREFHFLESGCRSKEYNQFMQNLFSFKMEGEVKHDDAPDSMAQLCDMKIEKKSGTVEAVKNPFRTRGYGYYDY